MAHRHGGSFVPNNCAVAATVSSGTQDGQYLSPNVIRQPIPQREVPGRQNMQSHENTHSEAKSVVGYSMSILSYYGNAEDEQRQDTPQAAKSPSLSFNESIPPSEIDSVAKIKPHDLNDKPLPAKKEFPVSLKGTFHIFDSRSRWRTANPMVYQDGAFKFDESVHMHRHRDHAGRTFYGRRSDRYLHHSDGYLRNLYVACTDQIYAAQGTSTWKRTYIRSVAPLKVRIATWIVDFENDPTSWADWSIMALRAIPATIAMTFVFWSGKPRAPQRMLDYAPVLYKYYGTAKVWRNLLEHPKEQKIQLRDKDSYRILRPRTLCILKSPFSDDGEGIDIQNVDGCPEANLEYLFVAYTTNHFSHSSQTDMNDLHAIAEAACRAAKLPAYWIACSCMTDPAELEGDVYRIADILRGASKMIIAVGSGSSSPTYATTERLLQEWGSRMWTFPEVLLSPGDAIRVYRRETPGQTIVIPKSQFPSRVWMSIDPSTSRHLIDHYSGSTSLSRLELATLALRCLYSRATPEHFKGDHAYALMGLLRMRPAIDPSDTAFQAFCRLSLANDSDRLLERYICTLPAHENQKWYQMDDAYSSSLWDIAPYCQVAGISDKDTVIIDGAYGVSIRWKSFYPVYWSTGPAFRRRLAGFLLRWNSMVLIMSIILFVIAPFFFFFQLPVVIVAYILLGAFFHTWIMMPKLVRVIYGGKFAETQAEMFGFEGYMNAPTIERAIFGGNFGRFSWTTNGSPLSRSRINEFGEHVGIDPCNDPEIAKKVEAAKLARPGEKRVFTLVDTHNMELTLFEAVRPPVTLMFCASEGGMQRAVGCSYEWETQTMCRETVLRLPTTCLDRMSRVPRFRMGIDRHLYPSSTGNSNV